MEAKKAQAADPPACCTWATQQQQEAAVQRAADLQEELLMAQALSQEMQVDISKKDSELASLRSEVQESQKAKRKSRSDGGGGGGKKASSRGLVDGRDAALDLAPP